MCKFRRTSVAPAGYMERYTKSLAKQAVGMYAEVAKKHGLTPTQLALAWCKSRWQVGGYRHPRQWTIADSGGSAIQGI